MQIRAGNVNRSRRHSRRPSNEDVEDNTAGTTDTVGRSSWTPNKMAPEYVPGSLWPGLGDLGKADVLRDLEATAASPVLRRGPGLESMRGAESQHPSIQAPGLVQDSIQTTHAPPPKKTPVMLSMVQARTFQDPDGSQEEIVQEHEHRDDECEPEDDEDTIRRLKGGLQAKEDEARFWRDKYHATCANFGREKQGLLSQIGNLCTELDSVNTIARQLDAQVFRLQRLPWQRDHRQRGNGRRGGHREVSIGYLKRSLDKEERNSRNLADMAHHWKGQWEDTDAEKSEILCVIAYYCLLRRRGLPKLLAELAVKFVPFDTLNLNELMKLLSY